MAFIESYVTDEAPGGPTVMEFYEKDELAAQLDNWIGPTAECMLALCRTAGFPRVEMTTIVEQRAHVVCRRHWEAPPEGLQMAAPVIHRAVHGLTHRREVSSRRDDYLSVWFDSEEETLNVDRVFPEVAGYGVRPLHVAHRDGPTWQVDFLVPKGLDPGKQPVRLRTANAPQSEAVDIYVDVAEPVPRPESLEIVGIADAGTFDSDRVPVFR